MLAQVCRRWRYIVFASPLRLNLKLLCTPRTPVRKLLDIWTPLPIVIDTVYYSEESADNIITALEHSDRVCSICIFFDRTSSLASGRFARAMQEPFPELTHLTLRSPNEILVVPETFLGGSATRLRYCCLDYTPFPALRNLLLSASHLVALELTHIPHSGYISPESMVACLSAATGLERLNLGFLSPQSRPDRASRRPPPLIRTILPALTNFNFHSVSEYLEDFISRVNAPLLDTVNITLFHQLTLDVSHLHQFIRRTETLSTLNTATVYLSNRYSRVELYQTMQPSSSISLSVWCNGLDWQVSFLAQACNSLSPTLSTFETLVIREDGFPSLGPGWEDDMENSQWLELFHPFTSLKNLYLSRKFVPLVAPALKQLAAESVTGVLPALQNIYLDGLQSSAPVQGIGEFVAARELFNHPVTVIPWDGLRP